MAQDIGLLLRGLGAAFSNTVPQFRDQMLQEEENAYIRSGREREAQMQRAEMTQARQRAMYQDAESALKLLAAGDLDSVISLGRERIELLKNFPDADPSDTVRITQLAQLSRAGDRNAYQSLQRELLGAVNRGMAMGYITPPQVEEKVYRPGDVVFRGGQRAFSIAAEAEPGFEIVPPNEVASIPGRDPTKAYQRNKRTNQISQVGGAGTTVNVGTATEGERQAGMLANRLDRAMSQVNEVVAQNPEAQMPGKAATLFDSAGLTYLANLTNDADRQIVEAAQFDMLDAALTLATGAAYTAEQIQGYRKSYFPQLGDSPETINAKRTRLQNTIEAAYDAAGRGRPEAMLSAQPPSARVAVGVPQSWIQQGLDEASWNALSQEEKAIYMEGE